MEPWGTPVLTEYDLHGVNPNLRKKLVAQTKEAWKLLGKLGQNWSKQDSTWCRSLQFCAKDWLKGVKFSMECKFV